MSRDDEVYGREWRLDKQVRRATVDLSSYPDLVVLYLGMRVNRLRGIPTVLRFGHMMRAAVAAKPDGLLHHETLYFSPRQIGLRQYWRDFASLERWARSPPHADWWREYLRGSQGTGLWHETYAMRGGIEAIYDDMPVPMGLAAFAPVEAPVGGLFSARRRLKREEPPVLPAPVPDPAPDSAGQP